MENDSSVTTPPRPATYVGLFLALFGLLIARQIVNFYWPTMTTPAAILKESLIWLCVVALVIVMRRGENLPWREIGIGTAKWWSSILWGFIIAVICGAIGAAIAVATNYGGGATAQAFSRLPLWLLTAIVIRAGVAEEFFYRGYAIERMNAIGVPRWIAAVSTVLLFGIGHWTGGWQNIIIALVLGAILAGFYLWRRDLIANMIGHFLVDFVGNVLPALFHHK